LQNSTTQVSLLTARGMSAIASIALAGPAAKDILSKVFRTKVSGSNETISLEAGQLAHGCIVDGGRVIDEVVVGVEADDLLAIHCHGNPLLAEQIVKLLQGRGATLVETERFTADRLKLRAKSMIETEAQLAIAQSATLQGAKILQSQTDAGLSKWARELLEQIETVDPDQVKAQCEQILKRSRIVARIIRGVKIVIVGAPNSGKSTLLNCLAGKQEVIVSDTAGTTRDWVSATCHVGPIYVEFIDTAGLDDVLAQTDDVEQIAQQTTKDLLQTCDLILHVTDCSLQNTGRSIQLDRPVVEVLNKCDLVEEYRNTGMQESNGVCISAAEGIGIEALIGTILTRLQVVDYPVAEPVIFSSRQRTILSDLAECDNSVCISRLLEQLLSDD
jgi:tRNA modification GTPase